MKYVSTLLAVVTLVGATPAQAAGPPPEFIFDPGMAAGGEGQSLRLGFADLFEDPQRCWSVTTTRSRGLWPYGRALHLYTVWCSRSGIVTYRESSAWPETDFLCRVETGPHTAKVGGGAGWTFVDIHVWAAYACHSPWWFDWHDTLMQLIRYHGNGWFETLAYQ